jgi:thiamine-monophosphate kinase
MEGVAEASRASGCPVVGGDVSGGQCLTVVVTVLGTVDGDGDGIGAGVEPGPVTRAGGRPGDAVLVTGPCGGSAAGLRVLRDGADIAGEPGRFYRRPVARLMEGEVARRAGAHAMIDVSDGLALDLHRLADASGVGFDLSSIPVTTAATQEEALGGGEDYELVLAVAAGTVEAVSGSFEGAGLRRPLLIGHLIDDPAVRLLRGEPVARSGWQHRLG